MINSTHNINQQTLTTLPMIQTPSNDLTGAPLIPRRYIVLLLMWLGIFHVYILRVVLSIAIIPMSEASDEEWSEGTRGLILSCFFWGYIWNQIPGGYLAERYGAKYVLMTGILISSFLTMIIPFMIHSVPLLLICRILVGFSQGITFPNIYYLGARWLPSNEKSRGMSFVQSGASAGTMFTLGIGPIVITSLSWPSLFYLSGGFGVLWALLWFIFTSSSPEDMYKGNAVISLPEQELNYIVNNRNDPPQDINNTSKPWVRIATHPAFVAIMTNHFAFNWGFYVLLAWLPSYMDKVLNFDIKQAGFFSILPYLALALVSPLGGFISDLLLNKKIMSLLNIRRLMQSLGLILPAMFLVLIAFTSPGVKLTIAYFTLSVGLSGFGYSGYAVNHIDLSTKYTGVMWGITNTIATIPGIVGIYLTGWIINQGNYWWVVFMIAAIISVIGNVLWLLLARASPVDFDKEEAEYDAIN
eukprot:TRINITY_DN12147_c0_g1_i1.p1 TRINITY_DN12147_c0_g1~~TRINITY_DN12147_c0_g1_i1.p1  ORF type:complete len:470 (-),score=34.64 TRINITY_DN12147_c0_g1_i1:66-1475(-)